MARRIGAETVELWTRGIEQYGQPRKDELVATYQQCWVEYSSTDEGVNTHEGMAAHGNLAAILSSIWIPAEVELQDADDYFIWTRRPGEKYRTDGDVGRYYDRRGQLRACVVPVEVKR